MPDKSASETLQDYFDSLLGSAATVSAEQSEQEQPFQSELKAACALTKTPSADVSVESVSSNPGLNTAISNLATSETVPTKAVPTNIVTTKNATSKNATTSEKTVDAMVEKPRAPNEPIKDESWQAQGKNNTEKAADSADFKRPNNRDNRLASTLNTEPLSAIEKRALEDESAEKLKTLPAQTPAISELPDFKIDEQDLLREEQKARLQKLLSQQTVTAESDIKPLLETELKREISEDLGTALPNETSLESMADDTAVDPTVVDQTTFHHEAAQQVKWNDNGRPQWAQKRFDVLLFDVAGLTLAVPLIALGQIVRFTPEELTPIFGQSDWFMGLLNSNVGRLRVVNTSLFVMPEKYKVSFIESAEYAISLDGVQWALAVNKVNQPISLDPAEIKWRSERSKRSWLAGTVKSHMCALLDIPQMANMLNQSDKTLTS